MSAAKKSIKKRPITATKLAISITLVAKEVKAEDVPAGQNLHTSNKSDPVGGLPLVPEPNNYYSWLWE